MEPSKLTKSDRILAFICALGLWFFIGFCCYKYLPLGVRAVAIDTFRIPTQSMEPTLIPGDKVLVNKMIFGARWYSDLDSVSTRNPETYRLWGWRPLQHNDIVVFNMPYPYSHDKIEFKINYVYCKRCIGLPGDSISIVNGFYKNSNTIDTLGHYRNQRALSNTPDQYMEYMFRTFPYDTHYNWNVKNFGPLYIPRQGAVTPIDTANYILYKQLIEFETKLTLRRVDDRVILGSQPIDRYTFEKNYYFMAGDNVLNSEDSRFWGLVPQEHIVGVVTEVIYSFSGENKEWNRDRFLISVKK